MEEIESLENQIKSASARLVAALAAQPETGDQSLAGLKAAHVAAVLGNERERADQLRRRIADAEAGAQEHQLLVQHLPDRIEQLKQQLVGALVGKLRARADALRVEFEALRKAVLEGEGNAAAAYLHHLTLRSILYDLKSVTGEEVPQRTPSALLFDLGVHEADFVSYRHLRADPDHAAVRIMERIRSLRADPERPRAVAAEPAPPEDYSLLSDDALVKLAGGTDARPTLSDDPLAVAELARRRKQAAADAAVDAREAQRRKAHAAHVHDVRAQLEAA